MGFPVKLGITFYKKKYHFDGGTKEKSPEFRDVIFRMLPLSLRPERSDLYCG